MLRRVMNVSLIALNNAQGRNCGNVLTRVGRDDALRINSKVRLVSLRV
jgi:hypothetical protein